MNEGLNRHMPLDKHRVKSERSQTGGEKWYCTKSTPDEGRTLRGVVKKRRRWPKEKKKRGGGVGKEEFLENRETDYNARGKEKKSVL